MAGGVVVAAAPSIKYKDRFPVLHGIALLAQLLEMSVDLLQSRVLPVDQADSKKASCP
jgi:hypothetical protein